MRVVVVGALYGLLLVAFGAIGAHGLDGALTIEDEGVYQTALLYHAVHAVTMVAIGGLASGMPPALLAATGGAFGVGTFLFCGTLYAQSLGVAADVGIIAPIGAVLLMIGWLLLAVAGARRL